MHFIHNSIFLLNIFIVICLNFCKRLVISKSCKKRMVGSRGKAKLILSCRRLNYLPFHNFKNPFRVNSSLKLSSYSPANRFLLTMVSVCPKMDRTSYYTVVGISHVLESRIFHIFQSSALAFSLAFAVSFCFFLLISLSCISFIYFF